MQSAQLSSASLMQVVKSESVLANIVEHALASVFRLALQRFNALAHAAAGRSGSAHLAAYGDPARGLVGLAGGGGGLRYSAGAKAPWQP